MSAHIKKYLLLAAVLLVPACQVFTPSKFDATGVPNDRYIVGGGLKIEYVAPSAGTVIWVDRTNNRLLQTSPIKAGEAYESPDIFSEEAKQLFGDINKINFVLYFIPAASVPTTQPADK